jgi:NADPH2:quinone reductase
MHAIRLHEFGPPENLRYEEVPDPEPGPGQVRIDVDAAGVHLLDTGLRRGEPLPVSPPPTPTSGPLQPPELPDTPGREVAGRVSALGEGVGPEWLGRRVVAHLGPAGQGYAEKAVTDVARLHEIPDAVPGEVAVAMIGTGRTAMAVLEAASLTADDVVVVPAAAGGLGALLVQAALDAGAFVVGLAGGAAKVGVVRDLGAHVALDYTRQAWPAEVRERLEGREVTVVLDGVGGATGRAAMELLAPGGRLLMFGYSEGTPTPLSSDDVWARGITVSTAIGVRLLRRPGGLRELEERALAAAAAGRLTPLRTTFPLKDAGAAHAALEGRATTGKVVLVP